VKQEKKKTNTFLNINNNAYTIVYTWIRHEMFNFTSYYYYYKISLHENNFAMW